MFIVPRVDGTVSAFEASTGKPLWNFSTGGPLLQSSSPSPSSTPHSSPTSHDPALSPSELSIFQSIQRDGLQDLYPETTTNILSAMPFMSEDGTIFLSHKHDKLFVVDPLTGSEVTFISLCIFLPILIKKLYLLHITKFIISNLLIPCLTSTTKGLPLS